MMIKSVSASGFKNLAVTPVQFKPVTLVMGENGIGKSNLLQLIHLVFSGKQPLESEGLQFELDGSVPDEDLLCRHEDRGRASIVLTTTLPRFREMCGALAAQAVDPHANEVTLDFDFWRQNGTAFKLVGIKIGISQVYATGTPGVDIPETAIQAVHTWLAEEVRGCTVYVPINRLPPQSHVQYAAGATVDAITDLENTILRLLADPTQDPQLIDRVRGSMAEFFKIEEVRSSLVLAPRQPAPEGRAPSGVFLLPRDEGDRPLRDVKVGIRLRERGGQWFDLHHVGTGLQQVMVILTVLLQNRAGIALIEEFDSSLSPLLRKELLGHLTTLAGAYSPISQVITTTHGAFRFANPRPMAIRADPIEGGKVNFVPANDQYLRSYELRSETE
jgi:predicted ATPase